jgi:uncharacterized OB-fold protein
MTALAPIAEGLWTDEPEPRLIGGRLPSGKIVFPMPTGDAAEGVEPWPLSRRGTLWSWTRQDFRPKSPYEGPGEGPHDFRPYIIGYVELPGEVIVESYITGATLEELKLGMPMVFTLTPFDSTRATFAFQPERAA